MHLVGFIIRIYHDALVGFIIRIYHDALSPERQTVKNRTRTLCLPEMHLFIRNLSVNFCHPVSQNWTQISLFSSSGSSARFLIGLNQTDRKSLLCHRFDRRLTSNLTFSVQIHAAFRRLHLQIAWNVFIDRDGSCRIVHFTTYSAWSIIIQKIFTFTEIFGLWFVILTA